jgi:uncharacterized protein YdhG (YjbR/CyaY superfamily)
MAKKPETVSEYVAALPSSSKKEFNELRRTIKSVIPKGAEEVISYGIPAVKYHGIVVYYSAWKKHLSMYPANASMEAAIDGVSDYKVSKGTLQFPLDEKLPIGLIKKIVKFRLKQNLEKTAAKK